MARKPARKAKASVEPLAHIAADLRPLAVAIEQLTPDERNARTHSAQNLAAIAASLKRFGQRKPLVVNKRTGQLEAGHGTLAAAQSLGWQQIAVVWVDDDPEAAVGFSLADNRAAELAGWDDAKLADLVEQTRQSSPDLFDDLLLDELAGQVETGGAALKPLAVPNPPALSWVLIGIPTVRFGEISEAVESIAGREGVIVETTVTDGD